MAPGGLFNLNIFPLASQLDPWPECQQSRFHQRNARTHARSLSRLIRRPMASQYSGGGGAALSPWRPRRASRRPLGPGAIAAAASGEEAALATVPERMKLNRDESSESENETDDDEEEEEEDDDDDEGGLSDESANKCLKRLEAEEKASQQNRSQDKEETPNCGQKGEKGAQPGLSLIDLEEQLAEECDLEETRRKRRRKHRLCINLTNCKYESVRRAARRCGLKEVGEDEEWTLYWTDCSVSLERVMEMKRFQKINHFPGMAEICRKDLLARNLNRMLKLFPKEYSIFPRTWCLPADYGDFQAYGRMRKNRTYICKPDSGCQGRGIFITRNPKEIKHGERMICQQYVTKEDICMHLTNYAINKHNENFVRDDYSGSKRKLSTLNTWMREHSYDTSELWRNIEDIVIKTLVAAHPVLKHNYRTCFPNHISGCACFEILGFDILLDRKLKPWLLEVNHSPSFTTDSRLDREVKDALLCDTLNLINLRACDKRKVLEEDKRRVKERLLQPHQPPREARREQMESNQAAWLAQADMHERSHLGGYRHIFPTGNTDKYAHFFNHRGSLFHETVASKAREECARQQLEEIRQKKEQQRESAAGKKRKEGKENPQGESAGEKYQEKIKAKAKTWNPKVSTVPYDSMTPQAIVEEEEVERVKALLRRENLIRGLGVINLLTRLLSHSEPSPLDIQKPRINFAESQSHFIQEVLNNRDSQSAMTLVPVSFLGSTVSRFRHQAVPPPPPAARVQLLGNQGFIPTILGTLSGLGAHHDGSTLSLPPRNISWLGSGMVGQPCTLAQMLRAGGRRFGSAMSKADGGEYTAVSPRVLELAPAKGSTLEWGSAARSRAARSQKSTSRSHPSPLPHRATAQPPPPPPLLGWARAPHAASGVAASTSVPGSPAYKRPLYLGSGSLNCLSHGGGKALNGSVGSFSFPSSMPAPLKPHNHHPELLRGLTINSASAPLLRRSSPHRSSTVAASQHLHLPR
ncbi:tubulin polyglutamylase TTLL13 isoform X3 [Anolis carolinensis]|uniref:tubulin polyglutamylase TTLL13 isoform X3 n=1 Tax=Anolis carolinensis TaxID=28377 RepID=UPI002F2B27E0